MKAIKIFYWITTVLIGAQFTMAGIMYLTKNQQVIEGFGKIGMPLWFVAFLGVAKLLGGIGLVLPTPARLKEWTYAGIAFVLIGAVYAHIATSTPFISPLIVLLILGVSYVLRMKMQQAK